MAQGARSDAGRAATHIAVVGVGGTGCALLPLLSALPITGVTLIDGDTVEERNLVRQLLFSSSDVGMGKVLAAGRHLRQLHGGISWREEARFIDRANVSGLLEGHSMVADCTDDLPARQLLAHTCRALGLPLVSGAVHGRQIQVFTRTAASHAQRTAEFFPGRPMEEQEGCDMRAVPAAVTSMAAALMSLRIADLLQGGDGLAGIMDLLDTEHARWMRIMGPEAGEFMDTPVRPDRYA